MQKLTQQELSEPDVELVMTEIQFWRLEELVPDAFDFLRTTNGRRDDKRGLFMFRVPTYRLREWSNQLTVVGRNNHE